MKCPGQDMQYWNGDAIFDVNCPKCGVPVEFYKDDTTRRCHSCGERFVNPKMDFGCASYCQFAEQCLGTLPEEFMGSREDLIKDKVAVAVKRHLNTDFKRIKKASNLAGLVEDLGKSEGGNLGVLLCAAYLHGLDSAVIDEILQQVKAAPPLIEAITTLLSKDTTEDADLVLAGEILSDALKLHGYKENLQSEENTENAMAELQPPNLTTSSAREILQSFAQPAS